MGLVYGRMKVLNYSSDYIVFLDADDEIYPDIIYQSMIKMIYSDVDIVFFNSEHVTDSTRRLIPNWSALDQFDLKVEGK
jgi:glycosyltransferase involved in cell wall biosynthesis